MNANIVFRLTTLLLIMVALSIPAHARPGDTHIVKLSPVAVGAMELGVRHNAQRMISLSDQRPANVRDPIPLLRFAPLYGSFEIGSGRNNTVSILFDRPTGSFRPISIPLHNWNDGPKMKVSALGKKFLPSLKPFQSPRALPVRQLGGDWKVEASFADDGGENADPVVIRNRRDGGRVALIYQTADEIVNPETTVETVFPKANVITEFMLKWLPTVADLSKVDVAFYTEQTNWIPRESAAREAAQIQKAIGRKMKSVEVVSETDLPGWTKRNVGDGAMDIIVLFGDFPNSIYPSGNTQPDGSLAERFLEDGNMFLNTGDYVFWGGDSSRNRWGGLRNMLDLTAVPGPLHLYVDRNRDGVFAAEERIEMPLDTIKYLADLRDCGVTATPQDPNAPKSP